MNSYAQKVLKELNVTNNYLNYTRLTKTVRGNIVGMHSLGPFFEDSNLTKPIINFYCNNGNCNFDGDLFFAKDLLNQKKYDFLVNFNNEIFLEWKWDKGKVGYLTFKNKKYFFNALTIQDFIKTFVLTDKNLIKKEISEIGSYEAFVSRFEKCTLDKDFKCLEQLFHDNKNPENIQIKKFRDGVTNTAIKLNKESCEKLQKYAREKYHRSLDKVWVEEEEIDIPTELLAEKVDKKVAFRKIDLILKKLKNYDFDSMDYSLNTGLKIFNISENVVNPSEDNCFERYNFSLTMYYKDKEWYLGNLILDNNYFDR